MQKGEFGYIGYMKKKKMVTTAVLFAITFTIIISGYFISGRTKNNFFTVIGIVSVLPATKSLVGLIVVFPHKGISSADYEKISEFDLTDNAIYDVLMTSEQKVMNIAAIVPSKNNMCVLVSKNCKDNEYIEEYLSKIFKGKLVDKKVSVFDDVNKLVKQTKATDEDIKDEDMIGLQEIYHYIISVV